MRTSTSLGSAIAFALLCSLLSACLTSTPQPPKRKPAVVESGPRNERAPARAAIHVEPLNVPHHDYFNDTKNLEQYPCIAAESELPPKLAPGLVQLVMHSIQQPLRACFEHGLSRNSDLKGRILVDFIVEPSGAVSSANATCTTITDEPMVRCVLDGVRSAKFPKPKKAERVRYPILFENNPLRVDSRPKPLRSASLMPPLKVLVHQVTPSYPSGYTIMLPSNVPNCVEHWEARGEPPLPEKLGEHPQVTEIDASRWPLDQIRCVLPRGKSGLLKRIDKNEFWSYLNAIHNRVHPIFSDHYLAGFERLRADHRLNDYDLRVTLQFQIEPKTGALLRVALPVPSGAIEFDIAALDSLLAVFPIKLPPTLAREEQPIVFVWEFHRRPQFACSTFFLRVH